MSTGEAMVRFQTRVEASLGLMSASGSFERLPKAPNSTKMLKQKHQPLPVRSGDELAFGNHLLTMPHHRNWNSEAEMASA